QSSVERPSGTANNPAASSMPPATSRNQPHFLRVISRLSFPPTFVILAPRWSFPPHVCIPAGNPLLSPVPSDHRPFTRTTRPPQGYAICADLRCSTLRPPTRRLARQLRSPPPGETI